MGVGAGTGGVGARICRPVRRRARACSPQQQQRIAPHRIASQASEQVRRTASTQACARAACWTRAHRRTGSGCRARRRGWCAASCAPAGRQGEGAAGACQQRPSPASQPGASRCGRARPAAAPLPRPALHGMARTVNLATSAGEAGGASRPGRHLRAGGRARARREATWAGWPHGGAAMRRSCGCCRLAPRRRRGPPAASGCRALPGGAHVGLQQDALQHHVVLVQQAHHVAAGQGQGRGEGGGAQSSAQGAQHATPGQPRIRRQLLPGILAVLNCRPHCSSQRPPAHLYTRSLQ